MSRKTILYIGGFNLPDKNAAAQRVMANSLALKQLGYDVVLMGLSPDRTTCGKSFEVNGMRCVNCSYPQKLAEWWGYLTSIAYYEPLIQQYNPAAVIAYNHPAVALEKLYKYNKKRGIKTLADCTEWYEPKGNFLFRMIKGYDVNKRMYKSHCKMDGIITISKYLDEFYRGKGMTTILLPPLVDIRAKKWNANSKEDMEKKRLVYAGSPAGNKDRLDWIIGSLGRIEPKLGGVIRLSWKSLESRKSNTSQCTANMIRRSLNLSLS